MIGFRSRRRRYYFPFRKRRVSSSPLFLYGNRTLFFRRKYKNPVYRRNSIASMYLRSRGYNIRKKIFV